MLSKNKTYFAPELIEGGHYIITGQSNDNYINDLYQTVDINQVLHKELLDHDFDIVLFYDYLNRLYCYDARSRYLLTHANEAEPDTAPAQGTSSVSNSIARSGPGGGRRQNRRHQRNQTVDVPATDAYHMRYVSIDVAWNHVIALIRQTRYRTAIVFSNMSGLAFDFPQEALDALSALNAVQTDRPHAAFYVFRTETGASFSDYAQIGSGIWQQFFELILKPLFETNDPAKNRVISLSTPNAAEVTNLLNMMRLRKHNRLPINVMTFKKLAEDVAYSCATNSKTLRALKVSLEEFTKTHPGTPLTSENYQQVIGVKREKTALEEIDALIGLKNVKDWINEWTSSRKENGMARAYPESSSRFFPGDENSIKNGLVLNIVFTGKPGTGKSTLAKQIGRLYYELGLLPRGHLVQCSAANLVSQNVGGTAPLVRQRVMEAMGGVLMIDEAYALTKNDFGKEAIDQLVNEMTQYAGQFAVVICGYESPMKAFLAANQGLASRFATSLHLEDYNPTEMGDIFRKFMREPDENGMTAVMSESLEEKFPHFCDNWANDHDNKWGNAREASTLLMNMKRRAIARMRSAGQNPENNTIVLTEEDIPSAQEKHLKRKPQNANEIIQELNKTIGLQNVKDRLIAIAQGIGWDVTDPTAGRYIFHGPPGTGKTHMARHFCNLLFRLGIIKRNHVYEVSAKQLCHPDPEFDYGKRNGETPSISEILEAAFENAKGGVIFIDEAPQLLDDDRGRSVLRALVPIVDRPDIYETTCVILAGYTDRITCMLRDDDGLNRRFPMANRIRFDNYSAEELTQLTAHFAKSKKHIADSEFLARTRAAFTKYLEAPEENFGNAGFIRDTYVPCAIDRKNARLSRKELGDAKAIATKEDVKNVELPTRSTLTKYDVPDPFDQLAGSPDLAVPPAPTVWERVERLVSKDEIKEYLTSRRESTTRDQFYDEIRGSESHFAIIGPSGTGRHTAARVVAAVLKELGVIDRDEVRITSKGSFEGSYVGHTIPQTLGQIEKAKGGCMLVENPSSMLARNTNDNTFGIEALSTIGGVMSGSTEKLSVIFIDNEDGFELLSKQMPDIVSKFSRVFHLEDLSPGEMHDLFVEKTKMSYKFPTEIADLLPDFFINWVSQRGDLKEDTAIWSNGNEVDKLIASLSHYWKKGSGFTDRTTGTPLRVITREMFAPQYAKYLTNASADKNKALKELNDLTGLDGVKTAVNAIERKLRLYKKTAAPGFYAFVGDPGSGKTKVAKLFGGILRGAGVLSQGHVIARTAKQLAEAPDTFENCLKLAKNGVFFIDEAPQLAETNGGHAVIKKLLTTIEDTDIMKDICIIIAGYEDAMRTLFNVDDGLSSRFEKDNAVIHFENYTAQQLLSIMDHFARTAHEDPYLNLPYPLDVSDPEFRSASLAVFDCYRNLRHFGNARFVRNYLDKCVNRLLARVDAMDDTVDKTDRTLLTTLVEEDIPRGMRKTADRQRMSSIIPVSCLDTATAAPITSENYAQVVQRIRECTVLITATDKDGNQGSGTGTIISEQGHILTCNHVLEGAVSVKVKVYCPGAIGGDYHEFDCTPMDPGYGDFDMALGKIDGSNFKFLPIRPRTESVSVTEETIMVGFPLSGKLNGNNLKTLNSTCYDGKICNQQQLTRERMIADIFGIDSSGMPGNSGSAVISKQDGRIIGVFVGAIGNGKDDKQSTHRQNIFFPIKYFWSHFIDFGREQ